MAARMEVVDETGLVSDPAVVADLVGAVLLVEGVRGEVAVAFVDEAAIAELNCRYRGLNESTDVLAFDYAEDEGWPEEARSGAAAGELVVCPHVVIRYAAEEGREPGAQLGWTLIHGALHLAGYDHETDDGEMRRREQTLLGRLDGTVQLLTLGASR